MSKLDENAIIDFNDSLVNELYDNGMEIHVQTVYGIIYYTSSAGRKWRIRAQNDMGDWVVDTSLDNFSVVAPAEREHLDDAIQDLKDNIEAYEAQISELLKLKVELEPRGYELHEESRTYNKDIPSAFPYGEVIVNRVDDGSWVIVVCDRNGRTRHKYGAQSTQELLALLDGAVEDEIKMLGAEK